MHGKLMEEILIPRGLLSIVGLELTLSEVSVLVASWEEPIKRGKLHFKTNKFRSFDTTYAQEDLHDEPDHLEFPWDYLGFDSDQLENGKWRFTLNSSVLEMVFDAEWPTFTEL